VTDDAWSPAVRRVYLAAGAALVLVVVAAGVRVVAGDWIPTADDAFLSLRSRAVFSAHPPLLSTASSAGATAAVTYHHPGPLALYLAAPFSAVLGPAGVALGAAVVNAAAVAGVAWTARRGARPALAAAVLAGTAGVVWAMGPEVLASPWNPNQATLALLAAMVGTWAVWSGALGAAPVAVLGASAAGQTHLSFTPVAALLVAAATVGAVVELRRRSGPRRRRGAVAVGIAAAVGFVSVLPPLVDVVARGGDSNVARIARGAELPGAAVGVRDAVRFTAAVLVRPPSFLGGSWSAPVFDDQLPSTTTAVVLLVALAAAVAGTVVVACRRRDRAVATLLAVATGTLLVGLAVSTRFPLRLGVPVPYFRWLWPVAALLAAGVVVTVLEAVVRTARWPAVVVPGVLLGGAGLAAVAAVPATGTAWTGSPEWSQPLARSLVDQVVPAAEDLDRVEVVATIQEAPLALTPVLVDQLDAAGVDVRSEDPVVVQQAGDHHRADGTASHRLVPTGRGAEPPSGGRAVARLSPVDPGEARRIDRAADRAAAEVRRALAAGAEPRLTEPGRRTGDVGVAALVDLLADDPDAAVRSRLLGDALDHDLVRVDGLDAALVAPASRRAAALDGRTVTWWLVGPEEPR
jgi:hypothetical protein